MMIKPKFTQAQFNKDLEARFGIIEEQILSRLIYIGERFINDARTNGTYNDITGNLRSSICYVVLKNGVKKSPGAIPAQSKNFIKDLISQHLKGYVLIVVAGMNYAAAVESKGKDVLTGSVPAAKAALRKAFKSFKG